MSVLEIEWVTILPMIVGIVLDKQISCLRQGNSKTEEQRQLIQEICKVKIICHTIQLESITIISIQFIKQMGEPKKKSHMPIDLFLEYDSFDLFSHIEGSRNIKPCLPFHEEQQPSKPQQKSNKKLKNTLNLQSKVVDFSYIPVQDSLGEQYERRKGIFQDSLAKKLNEERSKLESNRYSMDANMAQESIQDEQKQQIKYKQIRKAEKLGCTYYNQELKKIVKKHFKFAEVWEKMKNWKQSSKSRTFYFYTIHYFKTREQNKFMSLLEKALKIRLESERQRRNSEEEKHFIKEIEDEFMSILDATRVFFEGEYQLAIQKAFQRKRRHLHSSTSRGIKKAIHEYEFLTSKFKEEISIFFNEEKEASNSQSMK